MRRPHPAIHARVYPRMYGETPFADDRLHAISGLSPHVRGNRRGARLRLPLQRSIPACTGKPCHARGRSPAGGVYPRMYGETADDQVGSVRHPGLSPHVRGNQHSGRRTAALQGSIPACTGKPCTAVVTMIVPSVYPRMYGETHGARARGPGVQGLSPHVRGNRLHHIARLTPHESIPACTGKPCPLAPTIEVL